MLSTGRVRLDPQGPLSRMSACAPIPPPRLRGRGPRACRGRACHLRLRPCGLPLGEQPSVLPATSSQAVTVCAPQTWLWLRGNDSRRRARWHPHLSFLCVKVPSVFNFNVVRITCFSLYSLLLK